MTLNSVLAPFDDEFTRDFFKRRNIQFPSLFDSTNFFEESNKDIEKSLAAFRREIEATRERLGMEFPSPKSKLFTEDPFTLSKSLTNFLDNDKVFNSSRAIESHLSNGMNHNSSDNTIITPGDEKTSGRYSVSIPLGNRIQPEDLKITLKEENGLKIVSVEAKREEKSEDANRKSMISQQVSRKFTLPPNVDIKTVQSTLTEDGNLKIEAPLEALPPPQPRPQIQHNIPISNQMEVRKRYGPTNIPIAIEH